MKRLETQTPRVGVGVLLIRDGAILLGKRNDDPQKAESELHGEGTWTMPGGKLEAGETLAACAIRELFEETGIRVNEDMLQLVSVTDDFIPPPHYVTAGFLCTRFIGEAEVREPDKIGEWKWFPFKKLPTPLYPPSKKLWEQYRRGRVYN